MEGIVLHVNAGFEKLYGWRSEEVIGNQLQQFFYRGNSDEINSFIRTVRDLEQFAGFETAVPARDGTMLDVSFSAFLVNNGAGEPCGMICLTQNISERKKMERELRKSETKFKLIAENLTEIIGIISPDGSFEYISPACFLIIGYVPEQLVGKHPHSFIHPDDLAKLQCKHETSRLPLTGSFDEVRIQHKDGRWVVIEAHYIPIVGEDGTTEKALFVARDITEKKQTEDLLRKSEKLSIVGQLAAGVAHEIRNPLTSLKGFLQLIQSRTSEFHEYFDIMLSELERINNIVSEFMLISKPHVSQFRRVDFRCMMNDVISLINTQAIMNNVQIIMRLETEKTELIADENQLKQVFINLLKNAIEAMPDGGDICICIAIHNNDFLVVTVTDTGCGIPQERILQLGEPFYTTKEKGTGLGLMVSYKIIEAHRGKIRINSELNRGTSVEVMLPVIEA